MIKKGIIICILMVFIIMFFTTQTVYASELDNIMSDVDDFLSIRQ